jgi:hypothetical protein
VATYTRPLAIVDTENLDAGAITFTSQTHRAVVQLLGYVGGVVGWRTPFIVGAQEFTAVSVR